jgi:TRAP-type mannitol/chloroaromatic compound transport system permease small subunit
MLWKPRKPQKSGFMMLSFSLSFVSVLGVLTGEVVPVLGALVRYKLPALIFIFAVLFSLTDFQKIQKQFPILKKFHP